MDVLITINALLAIVGGILAASALILSKKPDAKQLIDKLTPYQAMIGVGLIGVGLVNFLRFLPHLVDVFKVNLLSAAAVLSMIAAGILLGALFGMPQITKWIPGNANAEQKALELTQKIAPFQVMIGLLSIVASLVVLLYELHILKMAA